MKIVICKKCGRVTRAKSEPFVCKSCAGNEYIFSCDSSDFNKKAHDSKKLTKENAVEYMREDYEARAKMYNEIFVDGGYYNENDPLQKFVHSYYNRGEKIDDADIEAGYIAQKHADEVLGVVRKPVTMPNPNIPRCPTCGSTDLTKRGFVDRAFGQVFGGVFSPSGRAQFKCNNCGYMW